MAGRETLPALVDERRLLSDLVNFARLAQSFEVVLEQEGGTSDDDSESTPPATPVARAEIKGASDDAEVVAQPKKVRCTSCGTRVPRVPPGRVGSSRAKNGDTVGSAD